MGPFNVFITAAVLALSHIAYATPLHQGANSIHPRNPLKVARPPDDAPIPRIHLVSPSQLVAFAGIPVPPTRPLQARSIVGEDNRVLYDTNEYPSKSIGRVISLAPCRAEPRLAHSCSASLIGPRHVMTARHCIYSPDGPVRFEPNVFEPRKLEPLYALDIIMLGTSEGIEVPVDHNHMNGCAQMNDWAILILSDRLGDTYGYFGAKEFDAKSQLDKKLFSHVGYPGDKGTYTSGVTKRPHRQDGISVFRADICKKGGPLWNDADSSGGQSGGPLFSMEDGVAWQYGVGSGGSDMGASFASGPLLVEGVAMARQEYP